MRLLHRTCTNMRSRKRASSRMSSSSPIVVARSPSSPIAVKRAMPMLRRDAVASVVKQFHALTLDQRNRAVNRVLSQQQPQATTATVEDDKDIETLFCEADKDRDGLLTKQEFQAFFTSRFSLKAIQASPDATSTLRPTNDQLKLVMVASAIPFVGFGFVDNIIMLAAGDMIEDHFHATYHMSMLCAAALGNTVSDVVGLSLGGVIETFARKVGIPDPQLSKAQANMSITHWCNFFASAGGITLGCLLGMFPLLFMSHSDHEHDDDSDKSKSEQQPVVVVVASEATPAASSPAVAAQGETRSSNSSDRSLSIVTPPLASTLA